MDNDVCQDSFTILRIKRKRTDEPLDALVIEGIRHKKSRAELDREYGQGVFQYAETVEEDIWTDERKTQAMKERISTIARKIVPLKRKDVSTAPAPLTPRLPLPVDDASRRYTILANSDATKRTSRVPSRERAFYPQYPPVVRSARELKEEKELAKTEQFTMYDAVPLPQKELSLEDDPEMASFVPMLKDYLRMNDIDIHDGSVIESKGLPVGLDASTGDDDDYVWDVFIHRTMSLAEWNSLAILGSVTGLPKDDDYPSDESEVEDEADEDSNEENWYANDYPEEESSESDMDSFDNGNDGWRMS